MAQNDMTQITCMARLCLATDFAPFAARIERRMRQRLDRLLGGSGSGDAVRRAGEDVSFRRKDGPDGPVFDLCVTAADREAALGELARLTLALVLRHPVARIDWTPEQALLDRETFLEAMAPDLPPPVRRARLQAIRIAPPPAPAGQAEDDRDLETLLRSCLRRPVGRDEVERMRRQLNLPAPERRAARATLAVTSAVLAMNASGAMASVLSIAGML